MKAKKIIQTMAAVLIAGTLSGCGGGGGSDSAPAPAGGGAGPIVLNCPAGYVQVPALAGYTTTDFCVAKYEMKNNSGAQSEAAGSPWVSVDRPTAISACTALGAGYDMISNAQWQTIARNIADTAGNWSTGTAYDGELSRGHSDNSPASALVANIDDAQGCDGTGQTCSNVVWDNQRRTHTLSNGQVVWDIGGNVWEWVKDDNSVSQGADGYISTFNLGDSRQNNFGNDQFCASPSATPYCGFGHGWMNYSAGAVCRGGDWNYGTITGVFAAVLNVGPSATDTTLGFRCVYQP